MVGCGYLGATHAACMAELGFDVLGLDVDEAKVATLNEGRTPFFEPGLEPMLRKHVETGRLRFTTSYEEVAAFGDAHFLCVSTPQRDGEYAADLSHVDAAVSSLGAVARAAVRRHRQVHRPGGDGRPDRPAARRARPRGRRASTWRGTRSSSARGTPSTTRCTRADWCSVSPAGGRDGPAEAMLREIYAESIDAGTPVVVADLATAELTKVAANAFLATKISFINAMSEVCEAAGADVTLLADGIGHDPRIGRSFLNAGLGFGGGCLPKDIRAFIARAGELGAGDALTFLREVDAINQRRRQRVVDLAEPSCWTGRGRAHGWPSSGRRSSPTRTTSGTHPP